eukprot:10396588-Alexandrium_andersonii.AAC.1
MLCPAHRKHMREVQGPCKLRRARGSFGRLREARESRWSPADHTVAEGISGKPRENSGNIQRALNSSTELRRAPEGCGEPQRAAVNSEGVRRSGELSRAVERSGRALGKPGELRRAPKSFEGLTGV